MRERKIGFLDGGFEPGKHLPLFDHVATVNQNLSNDAGNCARQFDGLLRLDHAIEGLRDPGDSCMCRPAGEHKQRDRARHHPNSCGRGKAWMNSDVCEHDP